MAKKKEDILTGFCIDCKHARDFHEKSNIGGKPFLCKCDYYKWSRFLYSDTCYRFEPMRDGWKERVKARQAVIVPTSEIKDMYFD